MGYILQTAIPQYFKTQQIPDHASAKTATDKALITDLKAQRGRIEDLFQLGKISMESYDRRVADLDEKIKTALDFSSAAEMRTIKRQHVMRLLMSNLADQARHLPHWLKNANPSEVNIILHGLFETIIIKGHELELVFWK